MPNLPIPIGVEVAEQYSRTAPGRSVFPLYRDVYAQPEAPGGGGNGGNTPPSDGSGGNNGGGGGNDNGGNDGNGSPPMPETPRVQRNNWRDMVMAIVGGQPFDINSLPPPHREFAQLLMNDEATMSWLGQLATAEMAFDQQGQLPLPGLPNNQQSWMRNIARDVDRQGAPNVQPQQTGPSTGDTDMEITEPVTAVGQQTGTPYFQMGEVEERVHIQPNKGRGKKMGGQVNIQPVLPLAFAEGTTGGIQFSPYEMPDAAFATLPDQQIMGVGKRGFSAMAAPPMPQQPAQQAAPMNTMQQMPPNMQPEVMQTFTSIMDSRPSMKPTDMYNLTRIAQSVGNQVAAGTASVQEAIQAITNISRSMIDGPQLPAIKPPNTGEAGLAAFQPSDYEVQPGDTLSAIAQRFGTTVEELAAHNNIQDPNMIQPGQRLFIPRVQRTGSPLGNPTPFNPSARLDPSQVDDQRGTPAVTDAQGNVIATGPPPPQPNGWPIPQGDGSVPAPNKSPYAGMIQPPRTGSEGIAGGQSYTVQAGDTLGAIAAKFGTTVQAIAQANGIQDPNMIQAGSTLTIPGGGQQPSAPPAPPIQTTSAGVTIPDVVHGGSAQLDSAAVSAIQSNFPPEAVNVAYHIVAAESKGNPYAEGGAGERGIFQIHPIHFGYGQQTLLGYTWDDMWNPVANAAVAAWLYKNQGGWRPWTTAPGVLSYLGG